MDPDATLDRAEDAIVDGDLPEAIEALADYSAWRGRGGFAPKGGDERASRLSNALSVAEERSLKRKNAESSNSIVEFHRASGDALCEDCEKPYRKHPFTQHRDGNGEPYLNLLCNLDVVKL